ncbi:hypothetical protein [Kitasatospora sp. NPDC051705]|uniref:hypothetical protein n=1 Tax=unclassified Kitasatospora TaxID=2633591 RepID=UPI003790D91A
MRARTRLTAAALFAVLGLAAVAGLNGPGNGIDWPAPPTRTSAASGPDNGIDWPTGPSGATPTATPTPTATGGTHGPGINTPGNGIDWP